ncbi:MAG TPA: nicotinate-nucleotide--dimethylbenzimidazole phosphoribosyltransferase [Gaiellaceae bacterium]
MSAAAEARARLDAKTKPRGSLGRLEELAIRVAGIVGDPSPGRVAAAVVVAAADHGVAAEGVSAYPAEVTRQMVANFERGGAAVSVLARRAGAEVVVVDVGVGRPTGNIAAGPALARGETEELLARGRARADALQGSGVRLVVPGEMGIGNSTVAAALTAALIGRDPAEVCGRGTGLDAEGVARKVATVRAALAANPVDPADPVGVLAALGGREIAFLAGLVLGAAERGMVVLLDGFISSTAALVAARIDASALDVLVAAHRSPEPGHGIVLDVLGLEPLLDLGLRLGEGSGAALALPLVDAALAILEEMATFADAGVTDAGR